MSGRPLSAKTKRQERDNGSSETRSDSTRIRHDMKADSYPSSGKGRTVIVDRCPSFRSDRARVRKDRRERDDIVRRVEKGYGRGMRYDSRPPHTESSEDIRDDVRRQAG